MDIYTLLGVLGILVVSYLLYHFADKIIEKIVRYIVRKENYSSPLSEKKREDTLIQFFTRISRALVVVLGLFAFFSQIGVQIAPLIAAAGIVGIAIGFGTQYLFRDLFTGVVLVAENQYRVGDSICINNVCGDVEQITLRFTRIRDMDGTVYFIPHGEIKIVANRSRGFSRINMNITVSHETDLAEARQVIDHVGDEFVLDPRWKDILVTAPHVLRVDDLADGGVVLKITAETAPGQSADVAGELRSRLKAAFEEKGIVAPFSKHVATRRKANAKLE